MDPVAVGEADEDGSRDFVAVGLRADAAGLWPRLGDTVAALLTATEALGLAVREVAGGLAAREPVIEGTAVTEPALFVAGPTTAGVPDEVAVRDTLRDWLGFGLVRVRVRD
jgi:hypothetical protein